MAAKTRRLRDKLLVWVAPPEWRPADLGGPVEVPETDRATQIKHRTFVPRAVRRYVVSSFLPIAVVTVVIILSPDLGPLEMVALVAWVLLTLSSWAAIFEHEAWAWRLEALRLLALVGLTAWIASPTPYFAVAVGTAFLFAVASVPLGLGARAQVSARADSQARRSRLRSRPQR
jgi:hypothetical protein